MYYLLSRFALLSNGFYLVPLYAAYLAELWVGTILLAILIVCSGLFHYFDQKKFSGLDLVASALVFLWAMTVCIVGGFKYPFFLLVIACTAAALFVRFKLERGDRGDAYHGLWHACIAMALLFCVLTYTG